MKNTFYIILALLIAFNIEAQAGKSNKRKLNRTNIASLYNENAVMDFSAVIYHSAAEQSKVYLDVPLKNLQYNSGSNFHYAKFIVFYELYAAYESKNSMDSGSLILTDTVNYNQEASMIIDFDIKAAFPNDYVLKITVTDLNRNENVFKFFPVSKRNKNSPQNFLLLDNENSPLFVRNFGTGQYYKIRCNQNDKDQLIVRYYNRKLPLAKTPFAVEKNFTFKFSSDSLYSVPLINGETELLKLPFPGIYHFQSDTSQTNGITLFHLDEGFPEIETPLQAILPLRYLTTQKEFDALLKYPDYKIAVDSFWLERASQKPERAKNMIAKYYQRVVLSNRLFTSYQEGWKTDRGIIFIIYGPPTEVYRKTGQEQWVYGERGNPLTINFYFDEVENPFTSNDFLLQRSTTYKSSWYIAIENWRR
jgi:GWxTD domain-containing protein